MKKEKWWSKGIRFECQGSGQCCTSRGSYGFVYMTKEDRQRMAKSLKLSTTAFTRKYCAKTDGFFHLREDHGSPDCIFLKGNRCGVYKGRPTQCRTWPFWPTHMGAKPWAIEVASFCPGVGKGKLHTKEEIEKAMEEQRHSERALLTES